MADIGWAIKQLKNAHPVRRVLWNGGSYVLPERNGDCPIYLYYICSLGKEKWQPSQLDLLGDNWELYEPEVQS